MPARVVVHTDGGARGNPGPAAIGVVVEADNGGQREVVAEVGERLGVTTNNVAEYRALIRGLVEARRLGAAEVSCLLDSKLVVEQMSGRYRVKHANVIPLHREATELARGFRRVTFGYVPRAQNAEADRLVNEALDGRPTGGPAVQLELAGEVTQASSRSAGPEAARPPDPEAVLARAFRDAVEIPRADLEQLNRRLPENLRYREERDLWRERWAAAEAVGRFAVEIGAVTAEQLAALEAEFLPLRPF